MPSPQFEAIIAEAQEQRTKIASINALIADLRAQIAGGASLAELDAILVEFQENDTALDAALADV